MTTTDVVMRVGEAISRCAVPDLKAALFACNELLLDYDEYPSGLFLDWLALLDGSAYDACTKGWLLLQHLYDNGQMLTEAQKLALVPLIARKFATGNEKQSFIVAILLGEICDAVTMLAHLAERHEGSPLGDVARDVLTRSQRNGLGKR